MLSLLLTLCLSLRAAEPLDPKAVKFVERFVRAEISELTPENIQYFMSLDHSALPRALRLKAEARRLELFALRQSAGVKKAPLRMPEASCEIDDKTKSRDARALRMAGFTEIGENDLECLMRKTECTEHDLMCEFTLQLVPKFDKKGKPDGRHVFFHQNDPIMTMLAACRNPSVGGNTNFFGQAMQPKCAK